MKRLANNYESVCCAQNDAVQKFTDSDGWEKACALGFDFDYVFDAFTDGHYEYDPQELHEEIVEWFNTYMMD